MATALLLFAQQSTPQSDGMYWLMLVSRIGHILGAIILVGGLFYIRFILSPVDAPPGTTHVDQLFGGRRSAWAKWVGIATALLLVTGFWNYYRFTQTEKLPSGYHMVIGFKMLGGIALFFLAALLAGRTAAAERLRDKWRLWLNICLLLGIVTVILGSVLRTYHASSLPNSGPPQLMAPLNAPAQ